MFLVLKMQILAGETCKGQAVMMLAPQSAAAKKTNDPLTRRARASIRTSRNSEHYITLASS